MKIVTRIGSVIIEDKKLLLVKGKKYQELWTPGGKIKSGESDKECLRRELKEEIDVSLVSMKFFKEYLKKSPYHNRMTKSRIYIVEIDGDIKPGMEIEKFIWYTKEDFDNKKFPITLVDKEGMLPDLIKENLI